MKKADKPWITVLTLPERPLYLDRTLTSLEAAGALDFAGDRIVFVDGDPLRVPQRARWAYAPTNNVSRRGGSAKALVAILRAAAQLGALYVLYFEDDVVCSRNAISAMAGMVVPTDCWALQFCDIKHLGPGAHAAPSLTRHVADHHWGTQALKIPSWTLLRVLQSSEPERWPQAFSSDVLLGKIATTEATPHLGIVSPSVVQHVGAHSVCNQGQDLRECGRSAHNFAGVDFDARSVEGVGG